MTVMVWGLRAAGRGPAHRRLRLGSLGVPASGGASTHLLHPDGGCPRHPSLGLRRRLLQPVPRLRHHRGTDRLGRRQRNRRPDPGDLHLPVHVPLGPRTPHRRPDGTWPSTRQRRWRRARPKHPAPSSPSSPLFSKRPRPPHTDPAAARYMQSWCLSEFSANRVGIPGAVQFRPPLMSVVAGRLQLWKALAGRDRLRRQQAV